jgi:hypothetical protein
MSESTRTSNTITAKSAPEMERPGGARFALELHVLVMRVRDLYADMRWLSDPQSACWLSHEEMKQLVHISRKIGRLDDRVTELEKTWRVRQGLSPRS